MSLCRIAKHHCLDKSAFLHAFIFKELLKTTIKILSFTHPYVIPRNMKSEEKVYFDVFALACKNLAFSQ